MHNPAQVKYMIPRTQDSSSIHSLESPVYVLRAARNFYTYIDRQNVPARRKIDPTEYLSPAVKCHVF